MELLRVVDRFSGILSLADVRTKSDDFLVDRLSYKFTTAMLSAFAVLCGVKSLYTVPIICWIPAQLRRYERAITAYCYANNTYFVPDDRRVPSSIEERYEGLIIYYQWLPWILGVQALCFCLPKLVWFLAISNSRQDVTSIINEANALNGVPNFEKSKPPSKYREDKLSYLTSQLFQRTDGDIIAHGRRATSRILTCYFMICYIGVKILYLLNCLFQIGVIHVMIGTRPFGISGFNYLKQDTLDTHFISQFKKKMSSGITELIDTSSFPKRTLCDFTFRELASNHAYTVECILPLNIIVEKIYVFLYLWFILLGVITFLDIIRWIVHLINFLVSSDGSREHYVRTHLIDRRKYNDEAIKQFAHKQLTGNNYFLLKLLSKNISTFIVVDMIDYFFRVKACKNKDD